eukprot:332957_1
MSSTLRVSKLLNHLTSQSQYQDIHAQKTSSRSIEEINRRFQNLIGKDLGASSWIELTQNDLDTFSTLTYDHNWIHKKDAGSKGSPFGDTIAHGLLTLSMLPQFKNEICTKYSEAISEQYKKNGVNYGFNKVRFLAPVYVNNKIRGKFKVKEAMKGKKFKSMRYVFEIIVQTKHKNTGEITDALYAEWVGMTIYN